MIRDRDGVTRERRCCGIDLLRNERGLEMVKKISGCVLSSRVGRQYQFHVGAIDGAEVNSVLLRVGTGMIGCEEQEVLAIGQE